MISSEASLNRGKKYLGFISKQWSGYRKNLWTIIVLTMFNTAFVLLYPYILRFIINGLESGAPMTEIAKYILLLIGSGAAIAVTYTMLQSNRLKMNLSFSNKIREEVFDRFPGYRNEFFHKYESGDISARLQSDLDALSWFMSSGIFRGLEGLLLIIFGSAVLLSINVTLTLITILPLIAIVIALLLFTEEKMNRKFKKVQEFVSSVSDFMGASFSGIIFIKVKNRLSLFTRLFEDNLKERKTYEMDAVKYERMVDIFYQLGIILSITAFLIFGGLIAVKGAMKLGDFVAFSQYLMTLIGPMFMIGFFVLSYARSKAYIDRIADLSGDEWLERPRERKMDKFSGQIVFSGADIGFDTPVLKDINAGFKKGEKIGIIGEVGSGKSTFIKTMMGIYPPLRGSVTIDGEPVCGLTYDALARLFGYTPQENVLFTSSIRENVRFADHRIDDRVVLRAIEIAQFGKDLSEFEEGLTAQLGSGGKSISGGQMQRIAIARTLVEEHCIYVFDDITSSLDPETEFTLLKQLSKELKDRTVFMISYRPYTLSVMDRIIVLKDGGIHEIGTHDELMRTSEYYRDLLLITR